MDTWARFVERSVAYQPWIWTPGNHEIDFAPEIGETIPFKPFTHRYHTPYKESGSTSPLWYSIKRASAHIINQWIEEELPRVDRKKTPWLIVLLHSPWYNSYNYHYMEGESMRVMYEPLFVRYKVDMVFSGHVHAYERSKRVIQRHIIPVRDQSAPIYITIGDGGNIEGLANNMSEPQPKYSAYREASFGHATLDIKNRTHAYYAWHRNQDGYAVVADTLWVFNRYFHPDDSSSFLAPSTPFFDLHVCIMRGENRSHQSLTKPYWFVRKKYVIYMPFVMSLSPVPPGYNAPQQGKLKDCLSVAKWACSVCQRVLTDGSDQKKPRVPMERLLNISSTIILLILSVAPWLLLKVHVPYTGPSGDLGQSYDSNSTLTHYELNPTKGQTVLFVGDLSYADQYPNNDNVRWDTWGRFVERSVAYQPWIWTAGNHELDFSTQSREVQHTSLFWHHIRHMFRFCEMYALCCRLPISKYTPQYKWLEDELPKVDRTETPWLIILMHAPWYNSFNYHYMEGETMRVMYEPWFVKYKVDLVFAGHVHAYERTERISNIAYNVVNGICTPVNDSSAPIYITIGDGGNLEGLATNMTEPQPKYSAFRESSFGHATLDIKNRTHAYYAWHRNQDGYAVEADNLWIFNRYWNPIDESTAASA
ncbi:hypothetical protein Leryth_011592 [Lithospermum erythrorhizon]|nr:hypothetical protein Leryth_011592 [Lithospermum erythrorhizon]